VCIYVYVYIPLAALLELLLGLQDFCSFFSNSKTGAFTSRRQCGRGE
jgi:hypothetical protein